MPLLYSPLNLNVKLTRLDYHSICSLAPSAPIRLTDSGGKSTRGFGALIMRQFRRSSDVMRFGALYLVAVLFVFISTIHDAEAARRRARGSAEYSPPQSAIVADGYTGKILYSSKADEPRYPASLTKVMTVYLVFEFIKAGRIALDTDLVVTPHAASQPPTKIDLEAGETIKVRDALSALMTQSANDAAVVIAENLAGSEEAFARLMTERARSLGMKNTVFRNASGLPNPEQKTTAYDMMVLANSVLRDFPESAPFFKLRYFRYKGHNHKNHNVLMFNYAGMDGMKTGFTNASGFNLIATAHRDNKFLIGVVFGGPSARVRNNKMSALLDACWKKAGPKPAQKPAPLIAKSPGPKPVLAAASSAAKPAPQAVTPAQTAGQQAGEQPKAIPPVTFAIASAGPQRAKAEAIPSSINLSASVDEGGAVPQKSEPSPVPPPAKAAAIAPARAMPATGMFHIQVGAYETPEGARLRLDAIAREAPDILAGHPDLIVPGKSGSIQVLRARFGAFTETGASNACQALRLRSIDCLVVPAE